MKIEAALIFGYNEYAFEMVNNVHHKFKNIYMFVLESDKVAVEENTLFKIERFDFSDDWNDLQERFDIEKSMAFCTLQDEAQNIFLTISLRSTFESLDILALAKNTEDANKLEMSGANKVIPVVQTTAGLITDMLEKPIISKVLHNILYEDGALKIAQIRVENADKLESKYPSDIEWSHNHGILVLSVAHEDGASEFVYSSKAKHHEIKNGDVFVVAGYEEDIKSFEKLIGRRNDVSWSNWSR